MEDKASSFSRDYVGMIVSDSNNIKIGRITDLAVRMGEEFPPVSSVLVTRGIKPGFLGKVKAKIFIPWKYVKKVEEKGIWLKVSLEEIVSHSLNEDELLLGKNVMDQQVLDNKGRRLLRVNDVKIKKVNGKLRLAGIEVGMMGLIRRLGPGRKLEGLTNLFRVKIMENIIMWDIVADFDREMNRIKLGISQEMLKNLYNL